MKTPVISSETVKNLRQRQNKIVVAIDFSPSSLTAAIQGIEIARMRNSELILLCVLETVGGIGELFRNKESHEKYRNAAISRLDQLVATLPLEGIRFSKMIIEGKPHKMIVEAADSILAEMIVMGTSGRETGDHNYIGSNVYAVVRMAGCPVVSLNHRSQPRKISKILVPVDPQFGIRELRVLLEIYSKNWKGEVVLLSMMKSGGKDKKELEQYLNRQKESLASHGVVNVTTLILESEEISRGIVEVISTGNYDMVWVETHGRSGIVNLVEGSVTEELLFYSPVPVLSLKPERDIAQNYFYHENLPI